MFVGETNYCARVISDQEYREIVKREHMFSVKILPELNPTELRSKVVGIVIRISVQLEQRGLLFLKKENTRIVHLSREIVLRFYLYHNNFYISTSLGFLQPEENTFTSIIHHIVQDTSRPLYTNLDQIPKYDAKPTYSIDEREPLEVDEEEEPPYKKSRTMSPLHQAI